MLLLKKALFILGRYKYRLPLMLFLFLIVSMIDVLGIGLIGPFVGMLGYSGNIADDYAAFSQIFGFTTNKEVISATGIFLALIFCLKGVIAFFVQRKILSLGYEIRTSIVDKLVTSYQNSDYEDISGKDVSAMIVNANTHVGLFVDSAFVPALRMSIECIVVMGIFALMAYTNFLLVIIISFLLSLVIFVYFNFVRKKLHYFGKIMSEREIAIYDGIKHLIGAFREIRLLNAEHFFRTKVTDDVIEFGKAGVITRSLHLISRYVVEASLVVFVVALVIYLLSQSESVDSIYALLSVFAVGSLRLVPSFSAIGLGLANIRTANFALNSLHQELTEISQGSALKKADNTVRPHVTEFSTLELRNVAYAYRSRPKQHILQGVNMLIRQGDFVSISGASGAGKSTLMDILTGMLIPTSGDLLVNNVKVEFNQDKNMQWWQSRCAYIPQSIFLINGSIASNIALGVKHDEIDYAMLEQAIKMANLDSVLGQNNLNIYSPVGESGGKLSGGQRQRVAMARAFYAGRDIIFMDEATSALDKNTEDEIMNYLSSLAGKLTIILITHSKSVSKNCNQYFQVKDGLVQYI
jgi:ABC-type bacteriocin/lantibiotic exporter with double-glycine peptidase domain